MCIALLMNFSRKIKPTVAWLGSDEIAGFGRFGLTGGVDSDHTELVLLTFRQVRNGRACLTRRHVHRVHPVRAALLLLLDDVARDR